MELKINEKMGYLSIDDTEGKQPSVFIHGDDFTQFMREANLARTKLKMEKEAALEFVAKEYTDCLWEGQPK